MEAPRSVGRRKERPLSFHASGELLRQGAIFNEGLRGLPTGETTGIPRGVRRFLTLEEADRFDAVCLAAHMSRVAGRRE